MVVPQGRFLLQRLPSRRRETLRAWDAADEYLLNYLHQQGLPEKGMGLLTYNDAFGALTVALQGYNPQLISDSWLAHQATHHNLSANDLAGDGVALLDSLTTPRGPADMVLIKVPKTLALLEDQLIRLRPLLHVGSRVIVAGMVKGLAPGVWALLERLVGPLETSLAQKKARLIFARYDPSLPQRESPYPVVYRLEGSDYRISNHANLFSRQRLDIGTRLFLQQIPNRPECRTIVDLGCGNGLVGLIAAERNPQAEVIFTDESYMAVASAEENYRNAFGDKGQASFQLADGLYGTTHQSVDWVLCNPPFHQHHTVGDFIALRMFRQSHAALRPGGELWVIGNRHLGYHSRLKRLFGNADLIASNAKFVVLKARKRRDNAP